MGAQEVLLQLPQSPLPTEDLKPAPDAKANFDICFFVFVDLQSGHSTVSSRFASVSNNLPQSSHLNSNMGMVSPLSA